MSSENDIEYYSRRANEEREKAERASDPAGYRIHTEFARHYERRLQGLIASRTPPPPLNGHVAS